MSLLFLLIASLLIVIALAFLLPPLWRSRPLADAVMDERNIAIARHRLSELKEQLAAGALEQSQYDEQRLELEQALSDDLDITTQITKPSSQDRWVVYVLIVAIPLLAGFLYTLLGDFKAIDRPAETVSKAADIPDLASIQKMVDTLAKKMVKDPQNSEGWIMLGRSYDYLQQYSKAADAFAHAYHTLGDKPEIMLLYANSLSYANDQQVTGKAAELVFKALAIEPNNPNALWLAGMAKAQMGDFIAAKAHWIKLKGLLPPNSEGLAAVEDLLAKVDSKMSETAPQTSTNKTADNVIELQVSLAPEFQKLASPEDTLFIYAQAVSGSKMPLAIVRKKVSDLPLIINLDDSNAMSPVAKLSTTKNVKLIARISKSGNAVTQAGDLIGVIEEVEVADKNRHTLLINSQIK